MAASRKTYNHGIVPLFSIVRRQKSKSFLVWSVLCVSEVSPIHIFLMSHSSVFQGLFLRFVWAQLGGFETASELQFWLDLRKFCWKLKIGLPSSTDAAYTLT
jgi:hypothetical protein